MNKALHSWIRFSIFNLLLVSALGVLMRYKIAYSLPIIQQKYLLHAHSHFAFAGWITQALMVLIVGYLCRQDETSLKKYRPLLVANAITAYGMLLTFPFVGYAAISITFSTLNIFTAYWFGVKIWRQMNRNTADHVSHNWFRAAIVFNVISSFGAFFLAYMMVTKNVHQHWYLAAVYFFLHFQYNGWFFFGCMGLLADMLKRRGINMGFNGKVFWLFATACIPAYFLSALWLPIPTVVYILVVASAVAQVIAAVIFFRELYRQSGLLQTISATGRWLIWLSGWALAIKLLLQLGSTVPSLSDLAFGFRPIVIGYLHLVLLAVISLFLVGYILAGKYIRISKLTLWSVYTLTAGIVLNEMFLMIQGISAMSYEGVPYMDLLLLFAGLIMFMGLLLLNISARPVTDEHEVMRD